MQMLIMMPLAMRSFLHTVRSMHLIYNKSRFQIVVARGASVAADGGQPSTYRPRRQAALRSCCQAAGAHAGPFLAVRLCHRPCPK